MKRVAFKMKLKPGYEEEYQRRHDKIWPELSQLIKNAGINEYSIFLDQSTGDLFAFQKVDETKEFDLSQTPIMQQWWEHMADIMETNEDYSPKVYPLDEVFYLP